MTTLLHTWQCPVHGVLHSMTEDKDSGTDVAATAIASRATTGQYALGCPERVQTSRGPRECGERVTHMQGTP